LDRETFCADYANRDNQRRAICAPDSLRSRIALNDEFVPRRQWLLRLGAAAVAVAMVVGQGESGVLDAFWTAPTTNTDGTPLTDLAWYRVYYGTSASPCPAGAFVQIPSSTSSPPPGLSAGVRLTNLTTGTLYSVSVAAVDASGGQSACSAPASALRKSTSP
jgi:hypothetical protein